ncbi:hypothetical protein [Sphingobacterium ginsenosidimutans]|uniref:hypothetical protein n=1 Tax=Sphingobacterium ginsenosidimutans TaxID=687845 RepID=UPI0031F74067
MWRERFYLGVRPYEKMKYLLSSPHEWTKDLGNSECAYNNNHPEYKIKFLNPRNFILPKPIATSTQALLHISVLQNFITNLPFCLSENI